ncbi:MAG: prepilin-type N-terminal cleavage/methylation domain-containing protein [Planctomycetota bacterium]
MTRVPIRRPAFSLMELLAVVTILGVIAALIVPRVATSSETAKEKACVYDCGHIHAAVERYRAVNGVWPSADLNELDGNNDYFPQGIPTCPVSGAPYTLEVTGDLYRVRGHTNGDHSP